MKTITLKRGYDIPLDGSPEERLIDGGKSATIALRPQDYPGVKFRLLVREGDAVKIGSPLLHSKAREDWLFTSPAGGTVKAINRGHRRALLSIEIEPAAEEEAETFNTYKADEISGLDRSASMEQLLKSGLINLFRERPFNYVANPDNTPRDIFVSGFDTAPLAADLSVILKDQDDALQAGLDVCKTLTTGTVYVGVNSTTPDSLKNAKNIDVTEFNGPHPASCVGVQIHHTKPIAKRSDIVWTITPQNLVVLGKLFLTGKLSTEITVAVTGSAATERGYVKTRVGASIDSIVQGKVESGDIRYISGNVLTGKKVTKDEHIAIHDTQVTVIPETSDAEFIGWMLPGGKKTSWFPTFLGSMLPGKRSQDTGLNGGHRAFVMSDIYEDVLPMDILPSFLIKSCLYQDFEEMEQLGIYELSEEEVALCEYICPSKASWQKILRDGLNYIESEG